MFIKCCSTLAPLQINQRNATGHVQQNRFFDVLDTEDQIQE
jgi:hypothetical protein